MNKAKFVKEVIVTDPDTKGEVSLSVFKHQNGGMFAVDSSYLDQIFEDDDEALIPDPFAVYSRYNLYNSNDGLELTGI